eukprot:2575003-Rhodomonas_salina.5
MADKASSRGSGAPRTLLRQVHGTNHDLRQRKLLPSRHRCCDAKSCDAHDLVRVDHEVNGACCKPAGLCWEGSIPLLVLHKYFPMSRTLTKMDHIQVFAEKLFIFCAVWSLGGLLQVNSPVYPPLCASSALPGADIRTVLPGRLPIEAQQLPQLHFRSDP